MGQRILLADTRRMVSKGLRDFLLHEFPDAFIQEATSPEAFVKHLANEHPFDVITVQQSFLTKISHPLKGIIIVLANKPDEELFLIARTYHARAYLGIGNEHMEALLRVALHSEPGEFLIDPAFHDWIHQQLRENDKRYMQLAQLTPKEREIAEMFNKGLSHKEIAELLCITKNTVKRRTANMRGKIKKE